MPTHMQITNIRGGSRTAATSKMEHFVIIVNGWKPLTIITKRSILDVVTALDPLWRQIILKDFFRAQWTEFFFSNYSYERVRYMLMVLILLTCRSSHCRCFIKKVFFKISQNSQESTCIGVSFLKKIAAWRPAALLKTRLQHRCFPVNFLRNFYEHLFGRTPFFSVFCIWLNCSFSF